MQPKKEVVATGGGPAKPLGEDIIGALRALIAGEGSPEGSLFGRLTQRDPFGITRDVTRGISGLEGMEPGQAIQELIQRNTEREAANLRARFGASGGTAFGTPAAFAESLFRAEAAPRLVTALSELGTRQRGLDLQALLPLLEMAGVLGARGFAPAREDVLVGPSAFSQLTSGIGDIAGGIGEIVPG